MRGGHFMTFFLWAKQRLRMCDMSWQQSDFSAITWSVVCFCVWKQWRREGRTCILFLNRMLIFSPLMSYKIIGMLISWLNSLLDEKWRELREIWDTQVAPTLVAPELFYCPFYCIQQSCIASWEKLRYVLHCRQNERLTISAGRGEY